MNEVKVDGCEKIFARNNQVYALTKDNLIIYDSTLTLLRQLPLSLNTVYQLDNFLFASNESDIIIINGEDDYLANSVFFITPSNNETLIGALYDSALNSYLATSYNNEIKLYKTSCPVFNSVCNATLQVNITALHPELLTRNLYNATIFISSINNSSKSTYPIELLLVTYGLAILKINEIHNLTIEYDVDAYYSLYDYFSGENMQASLSVNNQPITTNDKSTPAYLTPSLITNNVLNLTYKIIDQTFIGFSGLLAVTTESSLVLIIDAFLLKIIHIFDLSQVFFNFPSLDCNSIRSTSSQNAYGLLIINCSYSETYTGNNSNNTITIYKPLLILLSIELDSSSITTFALIKLLYNPKIFSVIEATESLFDIFIADEDVDGDVINNHLSRYSCN